MDKVVHFEIPAVNVKRAEAFYTKVFGWKITPVPGMNYSHATTVPVGKDRMPKEAGAINGGLFKKDKTGLYPVIVIDVRSIDMYITKIKEAKGKVVMPKIAVGDMGFYARIKDTEGNIIGIWEDKK